MGVYTPPSPPSDCGGKGKKEEDVERGNWRRRKEARGVGGGVKTRESEGVRDDNISSFGSEHVLLQTTFSFPP